MDRFAGFRKYIASGINNNSFAIFNYIQSKHFMKPY